MNFFPGDPMMMVTEHTTGTFSDYLELIYAHQTVSNKLGGGGGGGADQQGVSFSLPPGQIVHQMRGVACGMQYLSELGYVHKVCYALLIPPLSATRSELFFRSYY